MTIMSMGISASLTMSRLAKRASAAQVTITPMITPPKAPPFSASLMRITEPPSTNAMETPFITQRAK